LRFHIVLFLVEYVKRKVRALKRESMAKKGKEKNSKNKAKHNKLLNQKINKICRVFKQEKETTKQRLKDILNQVKAQEDKIQ